LPLRYLIQAETSLQFKGCRIPKRFSVHPEVDDASVAIGFKGTLLSLLPTLAMLFFIFPYKSHKGMAGLSLGMWTPVYVLVVNWVWGLATAAAIKFSR